MQWIWSLSWTFSMKQEYTQDVMPVHRSAPSHTQTHTFTHSLTPRGHLAQPVHLQTCFWMVGGNWKDQRKLTRTQREHVNSTQTVT